MQSITQQKTGSVVEVTPKELDTIAKDGMVQGGGLMTAVFTLIGGFMWLRRRFSHDGLEVKKEQKEGQLLDIIIKERNAAMDDAREAWARRAADAEINGRLGAQVESLNALNHKTNNEVHLLRLLNEKQGLEIASLRKDMTALKDQIQSCISCPLRRTTNETGK